MEERHVEGHPEQLKWKQIILMELAGTHDRMGTLWAEMEEKEGKF